ncbi:MAG: single-stranded-DNA-specific exonuclease RecJ [bacterium]
MEKNWKKINQSITQKEVTELTQALQILPITAEILISRGIAEPDDAKKFIRPNLNDLHNPFLLKDLDKAVERIRLALNKKEKILVYGDYDVDGITSITLLIQALNHHTSNLIYYLPKRLVDGYGVSKNGIELAYSQGVKLIITVDCGISAIEEIDYANSLGMDVIVCDHHEVKGKLPFAFAIINPKQPTCQYPDKSLAGVGVVMKLIQGLMKEGYSTVDLNSLIEFACLGTVADVVPITGENRIIVKYGLKQLTMTQNIGLKTLIKVCGLEGKKIESSDISFKLAPRINAIGRLEDAELVIKLFLTQSSQEAEKIVRILNDHNTKRQNIQETIFREAIQSDVLEDDKNIIVLANDNWHQGVIGIVASKIVDKYYRPTIIISSQNGLGKGSGRSISNFHLLNALVQCEDLLESYGGHEQAVGLTILPHKIDEFRERINGYAQTVLKKTDLQPSLNVLPVNLKDVNLALINEIESLLPPFGLGNPKPVFSTSSLEISGEPMIVGNNHLKMKVIEDVCSTEQGAQSEKGNFFSYSGLKAQCYDAIGFDMGDKITALKYSTSIDLAYVPQINTWQDRQSVQLNIKDIKFNYENP